MVGVKEKNNPIWMYFGHIRLVYSSFAYYITFFKETCNTKKITFHGYFHCVKFHFDRSKGKKIHFWGVLLPGVISTHFRLMRIKHISSTRIS